MQHAQLPATTRDSDSGPPAWDIDALDRDQLRSTYEDLAEFSASAGPRR